MEPSNVVVSLGIAGLTIVVTAIVNAKIRFASSERAAVASLRAVAWRILRWGLNALVAYLLIRNITASGPLTRIDVFLIASQVGTLVFVLCASLISMVVDSMSRHLAVTKELVDVVKGQISS